MPTYFRCLDYIWGVIDTLAETNLPHIRCKTAIHSENGSCCIIPREGDMIRVYTQLTDSDLIDPRTGRIDKERATPRKLLEVQIFLLLSIVFAAELIQNFLVLIGNPKVFKTLHI